MSEATQRRHTPEDLGTQVELAPNEIFVFGSNAAGIHGRGAAKVAREYFGAKNGIGRGITGSCYAIPTKDAQLRTLPLSEIEVSVLGLVAHAWRNPGTIFLCTRIGCGLAGYDPARIAPLFPAVKDLPDNLILPQDFYHD